MNKLSKRVLSLLLALLMVLGTCDQALAAGLDNGRYENDNVIELPENPDPTEKPDEPDPTEKPDEPKPTVSPDEPKPTVNPDEPQPTVNPDEPQPTVNPDEPQPTVNPDEPQPTVNPDEPQLTVNPDEPQPTEEPEVTPEPTPEPTEEPKETVTVKFVSEGTEVKSVEVKPGEKLGELPEAPKSEKADNYFDGWYIGEAKATADTEIKEATTVEAKFTYMPASLGNLKVESDKVVMYVSWAAGTFPEDAMPRVRDVSGALDMAKAAMPKDIVTDAIAFDITFYARINGRMTAVQPANNNGVNVSIQLKNGASLQGDKFTILHQTATKGVGLETISGSASATGASFVGTSFSVYIVVATETPLLTVNFKNGDTVLETMYVKEADSEDDVKKIIFDASSKITLGESEVFYGWTTSKDYTIDAVDSALSIDNVRSAVYTKAQTLSGDQTVDYYAVIVKSYFVDYLGDEDVVVGSHEVRFLPGDDAVQAYTVSMVYTPADDLHNFEGWKVRSGAGNIVSGTTVPGGEDGQTPLYINGTAITIRGDVTFTR